MSAYTSEKMDATYILQTQALIILPASQSLSVVRHRVGMAHHLDLTIHYWLSPCREFF